MAGARLSDWEIVSNRKPLVYLGEISYSTYMIHVFVMTALFDFLPRLGIPTPHWTVICLVVLACSSVSYHLFEVPARRWINARSG